MYWMSGFLALLFLGGCQEKEEERPDWENLALLEDQEEEGESLGELRQEKIEGELLPIAQEQIAEDS
jgi:hypothetical protein